MRNQVFKGFLKVVVLAMFLCSIIFSYLMSRHMESRTLTDMLYSIQLIDYSLDYSKELQSQIDALNPMVLDSTSRITVIAKDGEVLADTSQFIDFDDNHIDRTEIVEALNEGRGIEKRYSETLNKQLFYVAQYSKKGDCVVRLALPYSTISAFTMAIIPALVVSIIISLMAAFLIARKLSGTITEPLDEISTELLKIQNKGQVISFKRYNYDEMNNIVRSIEILSERIDNQMQLLKDENNKMDNILYNMNEGLVLLDNRAEVVIINKAAKNILDCQNGEGGKNIIHYTQNLDIIEGVDKIFQRGIESFFDLEKEGKIYSVHITNVTTGAIILIIDVTYERESQKIRQNFFSDASHELKTPITSINGYAELLTSGIDYSKEQQSEFLRRIKNEAKNMTGLINDILMISRMEANATESDRDRETMSYVKINNVINEVLEAVEPMANENNITIETNCSDVSIKADYNHMMQLVNNLVVNAIKYNKQGGSVYISSNIIGNKYEFVVRDTGIGIPLEYQSRVFERFFRVDKGRSKKMGGTGLGLAIVKHIANYYKGNISLKSKVNEGTEINVTIPIK